MIQLTRLNGRGFAINADLIERIDVTPDTVITLVDGAKYLVTEPIDEVLLRIREYRSAIVAMANRQLDGRDAHQPPALRVVPQAEDL